MIAALVTLAFGSIASTGVLAYVVGRLLAEQRRYVAALAAPSREAAVRELRPTSPRRSQSEPERVGPEIIGLD